MCFSRNSMADQFIEFTRDTRFEKRLRELKTIQVMIGMYCRHHHLVSEGLCDDCTALEDYAKRRLERCVFGDAKPNCAKCVVHCYSKDMREQVRIVMRWAGPRMLLRHPVLGIRHLLADHKKIPVLPTKRTADIATDN